LHGGFGRRLTFAEASEEVRLRAKGQRTRSLRSAAAIPSGPDPRPGEDQARALGEGGACRALVRAGKGFTCKPQVHRECRFRFPFGTIHRPVVEATRPARHRPSPDAQCTGPLGVEVSLGDSACGWAAEAGSNSRRARINQPQRYNQWCFADQ